jgi:hypothetical protein
LDSTIDLTKICSDGAETVTLNWTGVPHGSLDDVDCPPQNRVEYCSNIIQLMGFSLFNFIISVLIISGIYFIYYAKKDNKDEE